MIAAVRYAERNGNGPTSTPGYWREGDQVSPMQLAQWLANLKRAGLSDRQVASRVAEWRAGRLSFGWMPSASSPPASGNGGAPPAGSGGASSTGNGTAPTSIELPAWIKPALVIAVALFVLRR